MGLLSIIRKIKRKEKEMRILMVGLDNSGKTTIVLKINGEDTSVISPTLGFNIKTMTYNKYTLNIWDVGGQRTIRSYWRNYFEQTDGLVWVVDSSDLRRLDDCKFELHNLLKEEPFARMEIQNSPNESKPLSLQQSSIVGSCRKNKSENASFVSNLRDHIHEFMSTPLEGHKACLKTTIQKIIAKFPTRNSSPEAVKQVVKKVESSIPSVES